MSRVGVKHEMDWEIPVADLPADRDFTNSYTNTQTWGIIRDGQGCHHVPPTTSTGGTIISKGSHVPEHHARVQGNYPHPLRTLTLWIDKHRTWANPKARRTVTSTPSYILYERLSIKLNMLIS
jgi:hypothetical protein